MVALWWYYGLSAYMIGVIVFLLIKLNRAEDQTRAQELVTHKWFVKHGAVVREARRWKGVAADHKQDVADLATAVTPLLEQTDWMTGRWGGQFQTLQALEDRRNRDVENARRALMNSFAVASVPLADKTVTLRGLL